MLAELLDLILQEPSPELDERLRFKLPNIASEVITCVVAQINEKLSSDTSLLDKLYAFLEASPPLNPLLTSFFSKTFGILITRRAEQVRPASQAGIFVVLNVVLLLELVQLPVHLSTGHRIH